ncbi:MAG: FAD:protein FMN transferase [Blautia sp.]|nr:FAD:protein FMN transferase [Blautia sp.]
MKKIYKYHLFAVLLVPCLLAPLLSGCAHAPQKVSKSGFYFDTIITVTLYGTTDASYIDQCFSLAAEYERKLSNTIADSEISKINAGAGDFVEVSDETLALLQAGIHYGEISGGSFDITVGRLSELWNIPEIAKNSKGDDNEADASVLPDFDMLNETLSHVDYKKIAIDGNKIKLEDPQAAIDLGGIAKGFIADKMREYLQREGITSGILNLGGNVLTIGEKADGAFYSVGIQKPFADSGVSLGTLSLRDASVVSSGIYERYFRVDGKLYHHILDTATGYPVENNLYQVTIISESSMDGDALSTACFALGLSDGMALVESLENVEAVFVTGDGVLHYSSGIGDDITFLPAD